MSRRKNVITPSQQAVDGALSIFVDGCLKEDVHLQLFGLEVLSSATEEQIDRAIPAVGGRLGMTSEKVYAFFTRD